MTDDRDRWRKYFHVVANPWIEDGCKSQSEWQRTEINREVPPCCGQPSDQGRLKNRATVHAWKSQSEWQRTEINGESTSMLWPTLGSRTAKEQNNSSCVEESIRMTEDRDRWRKYVHVVANPRIKDSWRTEQQFMRGRVNQNDRGQR